MSEPFRRFLSKLSSHGSLISMQRGGKAAVAHCPAHEDNKQSLSVKLSDDGKVLVHCFAGCETKDILAKIGMEMVGLFDAPAPQYKAATEVKMVATYNYRDEKGELLNQVIRTEPKGFRQRRPITINGVTDPEHGWHWNLDGVRRVLYRLPEMNRDRKQPLWIVEGEKDADALADLGFRVTTTLGGASAWRPEYVDSIKRCKVEGVYVVPDNDAPGRKYAYAIATSLHGAGIPVKIVSLPGVPDKGDVSDYLKIAQYPAGDLRRLAQASPLFTGGPPPAENPTHASAPRKRWRRGTDLDDTPITYLVDKMIPKGMLGSISGRDKRGKSLLGLEIAKSVLIREPFLGEFKVDAGNGKVFMVLLDDPEFMVRDRLVKLGIADHDNLFIKTRNDAPEVVDGKPGAAVAFLTELAEEMREEKPAFLLIDALYILIPSEGKSGGDPQNSGGVMKPIMQALDEVANVSPETTVGVVIHHNKANSDLAGSATIRQMLKWILMLDLPKKYDKDVRAGRITPDRILQLDKLKTGVSQEWGLRIVATPEGHVQWEMVDIADLEASDKKKDKNKRRTDIAGWLTDFLSRGPQRAMNVVQAGWGDGFKYTEKEIERVANDIGVEKRKSGPHPTDPWIWEIRA